MGFNSGFKGLKCNTFVGFSHFQSPTFIIFLH